MMLIDENLSYKLAARIRNTFKGTVAVSKIEALGEGAPDQNVWDYAKRHRLAILTKDQDFVEYWARLGPPPKVIHIKMGNSRLAKIESLINDNRVVINQFLTQENSGLPTLCPHDHL